MNKKEFKEQMSHNRSTLYQYFHYDTDLEIRHLKRGKGVYKVFRTPYEWNNSFLLINNVRITDFESVILFTNELVVRFDTHNDWQINIPYKDIEYIEVRNDLKFGYQGVFLNKKN